MSIPHINTITRINEDALGTAAGILTICENLDLATTGATEKLYVFDSLLGNTMVSIQASWSNIAGSVIGTLDLVQSNTGDFWDSVGASGVISSAGGSTTLEKLDFSGKYVGIDYTANGITGGTLTLTLVVKSK